MSEGHAPPEFIDFPAGIPGFPAARRFKLEALPGPLHPFRRLRSLGTPEISFIVVEAGLLFPDYSIVVDEDHQASLGISSDSEVDTFLLITIPNPPQPPTANLLGPIVVNRATGVAAQVVQHRSDYKVAEPLPGTSAPD